MSQERVSEIYLKTVIIDDHPAVRRSLRCLVEGEAGIEVVGEAGNGRLALEAVAALQPDLLLLDINMPEMTGLEVLKHLRAEGHNVCVIILSAHSDCRYVDTALLLGANGYISKASSAEFLLDAIQSVCKGLVYVDPNIVMAAA